MGSVGGDLRRFSDDSAGRRCGAVLGRWRPAFSFCRSGHHLCPHVGRRAAGDFLFHFLDDLALYSGLDSSQLGRDVHGRRSLQGRFCPSHQRYGITPDRDERGWIAPFEQLRAAVVPEVEQLRVHRPVSSPVEVVAGAVAVSEMFQRRPFGIRGIYNLKKSVRHTPPSHSIDTQLVQATAAPWQTTTWKTPLLAGAAPTSDRSPPRGVNLIFDGPNFSSDDNAVVFCVAVPGSMSLSSSPSATSDALGLDVGSGGPEAEGKPMTKGKGPRIYVEDGDQLRAYEDTMFNNEDELQELLAKHVDLLAGDHSGDGEPSRWMLVTREVDVPDSDSSAGRWALDHLFVDGGGVPTLVEVKRATDTRIRREVVGQLLDYAANGAKYWSADDLRRSAEATHGDDLGHKMTALIGDDGDLDGFWETVEKNLRVGRMRLVFAADRLPAELVAVIEFLDRAMRDVEVMGLQVQQYAEGNKRILVTRTKGRSERDPTGRKQRGPVNADVVAFLSELKDALKGQVRADDYSVTDQPKKQLGWHRVVKGVGEAVYSVHFGPEQTHEWKPIQVGFRLWAVDEKTRDRWKQKIEAIEKSSLPPKTKISTTGQQSVLATWDLPWDKPADLNAGLRRKIAAGLVKMMAVMEPLLDEAAR